MAWREVKFGRDGVIEGVTDGGGGFILPVQMYSIIKTPSPLKMIGKNLQCRWKTSDYYMKKKIRPTGIAWTNVSCLQRSLLRLRDRQYVLTWKISGIAVVSLESYQRSLMEVFAKIRLLTAKIRLWSLLLKHWIQWSSKLHIKGIVAFPNFY